MGSNLVESVRGHGLSMVAVLGLFLVLGAIVTAYAGYVRRQRIAEIGVDDMLPYVDHDLAEVRQPDGT